MSLTMTRGTVLLAWALVAVGAVPPLITLTVARRARSAEQAAREALAAERRIRSEDIEFYRHRVTRDARGAADRVTLGSLYLQRARDTGNYHDVLRADSLARAALSLRHAHNAAAFGLLASALLAQHRFEEAHAAAESLVAWQPWEARHRALLGEIASEMGRYDEARLLFDSLRYEARRLDVAPRLARWAELNGRVNEARLLLRSAWAEARPLKHLPREQVAWFAMRAGDLELRDARLEEAERLYRAGLDVAPGDYRLSAAMARLMLARGRPRDAARFGEGALAVVLEPGTLAVLAEAYAALGDSARSAELAHVMEVSLAEQRGPLHRQWELFLLDRGRDAGAIAERARAGLRERRDVYGFDVMAWALYHEGRLREARSAMDSALRLGTRDPLLAGHSAAIDSALSYATKAGA